MWAGRAHRSGRGQVGLLCYGLPFERVMRDGRLNGIVMLCWLSSCSASVSGLNGFSVLLSGSQTPSAVAPSSGQLPSLSVPCIVLPSPTLGPFPVLYSPTMAQPASSAPGTFPNTGSVNFGMPGLGSAAHLLISPAAMVNPKSATLPSTDPQLQGSGSLSLSPMVSKSHNIIQPESPVYGGHPVSMVKQQVSPEVWVYFGARRLITL